MKYEQELILKDGRKCLLRHALPADAPAFVDYFYQSHGETDFLTTYPDESELNPEKEAEFLQAQLQSETNVEICAFVDGRLVGSAGNNLLRERDKLRHRAEFGISVIKEYWGLGIGKALTQASILCAREAGFRQLELEVVADNTAAVRLYEGVGFIEYGRNPKGFLTREGKDQELLLMRLEL